MMKKTKRKIASSSKVRRAASIQIKRAYDESRADDGLRVLIDRVWPRGLKKITLKADVWPKHLAPSTGLRKWYQHDPERYTAFRRRYLAELKDNGQSLAQLRTALRGRRVTLLTATRALELSHANVLREVLMRAR